MSRTAANLEVCEPTTARAGDDLAKGPATVSEDTVPYDDTTPESRPRRKKRGRSYSDFDPTTTKSPRGDVPHLKKKKRKTAKKQVDAKTGASKKTDEASASTDEQELCCICFDVPTIRGKINSCDHKYCYDCIKRWADETNTCPQCKKRFTKLERIPPKGEGSGPKGRKSRRKKDVISIKKKDIQCSSDNHLSGVLARVFEHFALHFSYSEGGVTGATTPVRSKFVCI